MRACGSCGGELLEVPFLDLGETPLANRFPATQSEAETFYPLALTRCRSCWLVQQAEFVPDEDIYGDNYGFYTGGSAGQRAYQDTVAAELLRRYLRGLIRPLVVEIGCNDGTLLARLAQAGAKVVGVDPSEPGKQAALEGLPVMCEPFTEALADAIVAAYGTASLVVANNVLAHIADLQSTFRGIRRLIGKEGVAVAEVQYLPDLLTGNMLEQVYHEHHYHWSLTTLRRAAQRHGLYVVRAELIESQLGSLRVSLAGQSLAERESVTDIVEAERRCLDSDIAYDSLQCRVDRVRDHLTDLVHRELWAGRTVVGYAAAAKATTLLNYASDIQLPVVLDTTPYKQGRFIPGVKVPIQTPELWRAPDATRLLLAPNYLGWLLRHDRGFLDNGGRWLVPTPTPTLI